MAKSKKQLYEVDQKTGHPLRRDGTPEPSTPDTAGKRGHGQTSKHYGSGKTDKHGDGKPPPNRGR